MIKNMIREFRKLKTYDKKMIRLFRLSKYDENEYDKKYLVSQI